MPRALDLIVAVATGSAVGGVARYLLTESVQTRAGTTFPIGTMVVNVLGCLALGFIMHLVLETGEFSSSARGLLTIGFCGGFTTFSTFAYETVALLEEGSWRRATLNAGASLILGLLGVVAGAMLAKALLHLLRGGTT